MAPEKSGVRFDESFNNWSHKLLGYSYIVITVVGLGNPTRAYERTRHNMGYLVIDRLMSDSRITGRWMVAHSSVVFAYIGRVETVLAKPLTYMNRSGMAVRGLLRKYDVTVEDLIVIHDDVDLDFGTLRIKKGGGDGGHKGLRSIIDTLETHEFIRIRMGIDRPPDGMETSDYVLTPFSATEWTEVEHILEKGSSAVKTVLLQGIIPAMNIYNRREKPENNNL